MPAAPVAALAAGLTTAVTLFSLAKDASTLPSSVTFGDLSMGALLTSTPSSSALRKRRLLAEDSSGLWVNEFNATCLNSKGIEEAPKSKCLSCRTGCVILEGDASASGNIVDKLGAFSQGQGAGECREERLEAPSCDDNNQPTGCVKPISDEQRTAAQSALSARRSATAGMNRPTLFLGISNYRTYSGTTEAEINALVEYVIGVLLESAVMLVIAIFILGTACCVRCARAPCGSDSRSADSGAVKTCRMCGAGACCVPCHPKNGDNVFTLCCKCVVCLPLLPCSCNCGMCCPCCRPKATVVMLMSKEAEGNATIFSGGPDSADGDETYAAASVYRSEVHCCAGGTVPSVQCGSCGGPCSGCDLCCGLCDLCNPCCRTNMFDIQRSQGRQAGYSPLSAKALAFFTGIMFALMFVGYASGMSGRIAVENGFNLIPPAAVNSMDSLLHKVIEVSGGLMSMSSQIDKITANNERSGCLPEAGTGNVAASTFVGMSSSIQAAHAFKSMICTARQLISAAAWYIGFSLYATLAFPFCGWVVGAVGAVQIVPAVGTAVKPLKRLPLAGGCCMLVFAVAAGILFVFFNPLGLIVSDVCLLMKSVQNKGALEGFPGGHAPPQCGRDGTFGAVRDSMTTIVDNTYSGMCSAYNSTCDVGVAYTVEGGGSGLDLTVCPQTVSAATADKPTKPLTEVISEDVCTNQAVDVFKDYSKNVQENVAYVNVRYGPAEERTASKVVPFSFPSKTHNGLCEWSYFDAQKVPSKYQGTSYYPSAKWTADVLYPTFVAAGDLRKASCTNSECGPNADGCGSSASDYVRSFTYGGKASSVSFNWDTKFERQGPSTALYKCHGAFQKPAVMTPREADPHLFATKTSTDFAPANEDMLTLAVEPVLEYDNGEVTAEGMKVSYSCYDTEWDETALKFKKKAGSSVLSTCSSHTADSINNIDWSSATIADCKTLAKKLVGGAGFKDDDTRYTIADGVCQYTASSAMIKTDEAPFACIKDDRDTPVVCDVTKVSLTDCSSSMASGVCSDEQKQPTAALTQGSQSFRTGKCCDDPRSQRFSQSITMSDKLAKMSEDLLEHGYSAKDKNQTCESDEIKEVIAYPTQCRAGEKMRAIVDCGFLQVMAKELEDPICNGIGAGLVAVTTAYQINVFLYCLLAWVLFAGYKRWQTNLQASAVTVNTQEEEKVDKFSSASVFKIMRKKVDLKELSKRPRQYTLDPNHCHTVVWGTGKEYDASETQLNAGKSAAEYRAAATRTVSENRSDQALVGGGPRGGTKRGDL